MVFFQKTHNPRLITRKIIDKLRMGGHSTGYRAIIPQDCWSSNVRKKLRPEWTKEIWQLLSATWCMDWIQEQSNEKW